MDEKKLSVILEAVADKIQTLGLDLTIKDIKIGKLTEENERLKRENDILRKDNVALTRELRGEVVFEKIERFDNGKL
jgi:hypothetical protein